MQNTLDVLIEFGKMLIPASVVLYAIYLLVRTLITKELDMKRLEIKGKNIETTLPLRLQAYERMTLFLERMAPPNLLLRLNNAAQSARDLHSILLAEIQNEYNHNLSQQIYMSEEVWLLIKNTKDGLINRINEASAQMKENASGIDLSKQILQTLMDKKTDPTTDALSALKQEIQRIF